MTGNFERHAVEELAHGPRALLEVEKAQTAPASTMAMKKPSCCTNLRHVDDELREGRQVGAEALEQRFELRDHEDQQDDRHDDGHHQHRGRVEQRLLDLLLQRLGLFLVGGDLVEQRLERAGLLAGLDEVHEQVVEVQRVLAERLVQRGAAFDVGLDVEDQLLHRRLVVAVADDLERLHQRNAGASAWWPAGGLKTAMSPALTLPPLAALRLLADARWRDALAAQVRRAGSARRARGSCP